MTQEDTKMTRRWAVLLGLIVLSILNLGANGCPDNPCKTVACTPGYHCEIAPTWPPAGQCVADPLPSPSPTPGPSPSPSPIPSPTPVPSPSPTPSPIPTPSPSPSPTPCIPKSIPSVAVKPTKVPCAKGFVDSAGYCWAKHDPVAQQTSDCRACADHMGIDIRGGHATKDAEGWWTDNGAYRIDAYCRRTVDGQTLLPGSWEWRGDCPPAVLKECPPTPTPSPSPSPLPTPSPGVGCPVGCESPHWLGVALRSVTGANPQGGKFLGKRYNVDATAHTFDVACQEHPGDNTEWKKACQAEHWPRGPEFYMSLPGHFDGDRCDAFSGNTAGDWWCHHKPEGDNGPSGKGAQTGPTTFWATPPGTGPGDALPCPGGKKCSVTIDVQP